MKKTLSLLVCLLFILTTCLFPVNAVENDTDESPLVRTGEEVLNLACEVWPEFSDKLINPQVQSAKQRSATDEVVQTLSHQLSETETLMYVEYASGLAFASTIGYWTEESSADCLNGRCTTYIGSVTIANGGCTSLLMGFKYIIYPLEYDRISNFGSFVNTNTSIHVHDSQVHEIGDSDPAFYKYMVYFQGAEGYLLGQALVHVSVGQNKLTLTFA